MAFRVELETFRGPLDLLLYLVRRHEVEVVDLPIAIVTEQFLTYLELLKELNVDAVGEFLEMASTLIEMKSRLVLPHADEVEEEVDVARHELVARLLEYKKFKDAASMLEEKSRAWHEHFPRTQDRDEEPPSQLADQPIREVELWDLVSAFGRIMQQHRVDKPASIIYDDTPIHVFMERIQELLARSPQLALSELFRPAMHKSTMIGIFLAVLELVRHHSVRAEQNENFGEVWLMAPAKPSPQGKNVAAASEPDSESNG